MNAKYFLLFFILLFSLAPVHAQEQFDDIIEEIIPTTKLSNEQLNHLRQELKVQKMFIEGVKQIELHGGEFINLDKSTNTLHELMVSSVGARTSSISNEAKEQIEDVIKHGLKKDGIKNILIKSKEFAFDYAHKKNIFMTSLTRRFGFDVGLVYLSSLQLDLTFPLIMMASGQPQYAVLLATPVSSIATGAYAAIKSAVKFNQIVKMLGGIKNTFNHFSIFREVKKFFNENLLLKYDLIDFNFLSNQYVLTVERQNLLSKFLGKLGFNNQLNYRNLMQTLEEKGLLSELTEQLRRSERPEEVKFIRLINKIQVTANEEVLKAMQENFGSFIQEMDNIPDFTQQRRWSVSLANSQNFDQFIIRLAQMPDDIPPKIFDRMWRNYILQNSSKTIGPYIDKETYKAFRKLIEDYDKTVRHEFMTSVDTKIGPQMKSKFTEYLYQSLSNVGICGHLFKKRGEFPPLL